MRIIPLLFSIFFLYPKVVFCQVNGIDGNVLYLLHPRDTVHVERLPFRTISVLDGRIDIMDTTDAVGAYKAKRKASFRYTIPLHLDTTLDVAMDRYLNKWYVSGTGDLNLCIYLRKYVLFDRKVAMGADVYTEKNGSFHKVLVVDTLFDRHWKYYISGGALDLLMEKVRRQWQVTAGRPGPEISLKEIKARKDGLAWNRFPILQSNLGINGVYRSVDDLLQARPQTVSGVVYGATDTSFNPWPDRVPSYFVTIPPGDTLYSITFSKAYRKNNRWLRRWGRQRYALISQNGVLYIRLKMQTFLKLTRVGNIFRASISPDLVMTFLEFGMVGDGYNDSTPVNSSLGAAGIFAIMASLSQASRKGIAKHDKIVSHDSSDSGWHFYIDMDLGAVICY